MDEFPYEVPGEQPVIGEPVAPDANLGEPEPEVKPEKKKRAGKPALNDAYQAAPQADASPAFDLASLYDHMPEGFADRLAEALHARGLVEPADYFKPGAPERFQSAMRAVIKQDFLSARALAKGALGKKDAS